jgi:hypothetical protein
MTYGPDAAGLYMYNEIWSPWLPNAGSGSNYQIEFLTYRDLPLDNLQFYIWQVRSRGASGCPLTWNSDTFVYFGDQKDWFPELFQIGTFVPAGAVDVQFALGAIDACGFWCGIYGSGACHSHAPLIDQVKFYRLAFAGPQWLVRDIDLWAELARRKLAHIGISLTTLDGQLARQLEPRASAPHARLDAMQKLGEAGIPVSVFVSPVIPGLNDHELENLLAAARAHGAESACYTLLRLPHEVAALLEKGGAGLIA